MSILFLLAQLALAPATTPSTAAPAEPAPAPTTPAPTTPAPTTPAPTTPAPAEPPAPGTEPPPPTAEPTAPVPVAEPVPETTPAPAPVEMETVTPPKAVQPERKHRGQFAFYWDMSQSVGSSYRFVNDYSVRGFSSSFSYRVIPLVGVGVLFGYTYTDDVVHATRRTENAALTATELRSTETIPIMATATIHIPTGRGGLRGRGWAEPFVGLGVGTYYTFRRADAGWVYGEDSGWHFGMMPTLGVQLDTPGPQVILSSRFNWAAKTDQSPQELFFTFNLGLGFFAF